MFHPNPPKDSIKVGIWFISKGSIIRHVYYSDRTSMQRYPKKYYQKIKSNEDLEKFVARLNGRGLAKEKAKAEALFRHAFISPSLLDEFERYLHAQIPTEKDARYRFGAMKEYFLNYFIVELDLKDPVDWHTHQIQWGEYLLKTGKAEDTLRKIIQKANLFIQFLHRKFPQEVPNLYFKPISKARFKLYESERLLDKNNKIGKFIPKAHWRKIKANLPGDIKPFILLAYYYGLRRSECLAIRAEDIRKGYLSIRRKLKKTGVFAPLKDREDRKTEHWFIKPSMAYKIVNMIEVRIHPDTLGKKFNELMNELGFDYQIHDLRRTFITRALRKHAPVDVRIAVGHESIDTTMKYLMDDRDLDDEQFKPTG